MRIEKVIAIRISIRAGSISLLIRLGEHTIVGIENLFKKQYSQHELSRAAEFRSQNGNE